MEGSHLVGVLWRNIASRAVSFRPDVVLLDIGLPGMNGYEVAQKMRELPGSQTSGWSLSPGYGRSDDRLRARDAGFDDHLTKPVEFAVLDRALNGSARGLGWLPRFRLAGPEAGHNKRAGDLPRGCR